VITNGTIGLFTTRIDSTYNMNIWNAVYQGARSKNYNLMTYRGNSITYDKTLGRLNKNAVYDNIDFDRIDGFILVSTSISNDISAAAYDEFCSRFNPKPMVSIGAAPAFVHRCLIDNSSGFYNLVTHLIKEHHCASFVYIGGPKMGKEAIIRYNAFREALADHRVQFNESLLCYGNFQADLARTHLLEIIQKKIKFDAVVAANDDMALAASATLQESGYEVPGDVKVIGFDDVPTAMISNPPLSTVRQPIYSQSFLAVSMLVDLLENKQVGMEEYIQTTTVIRQSCGCGRADLESRNDTLSFRNEFVLEKQHRDDMAARISSLMKNSLIKKSTAAIDELIDLFMKDLTAGGRSYLEKLSDVFDRVSEFNDLDVWQEILIAIEKGFLPCLSQDIFPRFSELKKGHDGLIHDKRMTVQSRKYELSNIENRNLREVIQGLGFSFEIQKIHNFMADNFKDRLDIASGYLVLFEDGTSDRCRIMAGFDRNGKLDLASLAAAYPAKYLIPDGEHRLSGNSFFVSPIIWNGLNIGLIILEVGTTSGYIYESLAAQLTSSLWGSFLLRDSTASEKKMLAWNTKIESLVKPMLEMIRQVAEITTEKMTAIVALNELSLKSSNKISETSGMIRGVSAKFKEMMDIIGIIDGISTTVKLVSINASIESTHAGQYGSGFKVIAKEINALSESTRRNAENISQTLRTVIDMIKFSIAASEVSTESFQEQEKSVDALLQSLKIISDFMEKLDAGSKEILSFMEKK
jgi:DNA-binding LacI/PurR family transcriptional regulator